MRPGYPNCNNCNLFGLLAPTQEAADQLGVSARRVRALVAQGDLDAVLAGRTLLIQPESVARHQGRGVASTRPLSPRMSWAALLTDIGSADIDQVSNGLALSPSERRRLLELHHRPSSDWAWLARRRASVKGYSACAAYLTEIVHATGVVVSGVSALDRFDIDLTARADTAEVYAGAAECEVLARTFTFRADATGNLIVRVLPQIDGPGRLLEGR